MARWRHHGAGCVEKRYDRLGQSLAVQTVVLPVQADTHNRKEDKHWTVFQCRMWRHNQQNFNIRTTQTADAVKVWEQSSLISYLSSGSGRTGVNSQPSNSSLGASVKVQLHSSLGLSICFQAQYSASRSKLLLSYNQQQHTLYPSYSISRYMYCWYEFYTFVPLGSHLQLCVHVEHQLVTLSAHVHQLFVERKLKLVDAIDVGFDSSFGQLVCGFHRGHLQVKFQCTW